jgi:hypothetical protein
MKPQASTGRPSRLQYGFPIAARRLRTPSPPFRVARTIDAELDSACWIETPGRGAVEISSIADHRGDDE